MAQTDRSYLPKPVLCGANMNPKQLFRYQALPTQKVLPALSILLTSCRGMECNDIRGIRSHPWRSRCTIAMVGLIKSSHSTTYCLALVPYQPLRLDPCFLLLQPGWAIRRHNLDYARFRKSVIILICNILVPIDNTPELYCLLLLFYIFFLVSSRSWFMLKKHGYRAWNRSHRPHDFRPLPNSLPAYCV
jgi:hypothetical protein